MCCCTFVFACANGYVDNSCLTLVSNLVKVICSIELSGDWKPIGVLFRPVLEEFNAEMII